MLEYLRIKNLALIDDIELEFSPGLNILTGETGSGKSFILKALNFLMGEKLHSTMVRQGKECAQIEGLFIHPEKGEVVIRRELSAATARTKSYINGNLCATDTIKELRTKLVTQTSQHAQQKLLQPAFQEKLFESWIQKPILISKKQTLVEKIKTHLDQYNALTSKTQDLTARKELFEMYLHDIERINPKKNEDEELEKLKNQLRSTVTTSKNCKAALQIIRNEEHSILTQLGLLEKYITPLIPLENTFSHYASNILEFKGVLNDIEQHLRMLPTESTNTSNPESIEQRLFELSQLKRKFQKTLPEILLFKQELHDKLSYIDAATLDLKQLKKEEIILTQELQTVLDEIMSIKKTLAPHFCANLKEKLIELGFSEYIDISIDFTAYAIVPGCIDHKIHFTWTPNPGQPAQPLERIASGGELSRFLLACISMQSEKHDEGLLIFDEIDSGIGGHTLTKVATKLAMLAEEKQLLVITHWPQIAAKAHRHFCISKDIENHTTYTRCKQLSIKEQKLELLRMVGTNTPSYA